MIMLTDRIKFPYKRTLPNNPDFSYQTAHFLGKNNIQQEQIRTNNFSINKPPEELCLTFINFNQKLSNVQTINRIRMGLSQFLY